MTLTTIQIACVVGFTLFAVTFVGVAAAFIYYVYTAWKTKESERQELYKLHWDKAVEIYPLMLIITFLFAQFYMAQYLDQGFSMSGIDLIPYLQWVIVTATGAIEMFMLCFIMNYHSRNYHRFIVVVVYTYSLASIIAATFSVTNEQRVNWMVGSVLAFIGAMGFLFFPKNMIRDAGYEMGVWQILFSEHTKPQRHNITQLYMYAYRCLLLAQIIFLYVAYFIIWFLSSYNGFSGALGLDNSTITLVVFNWLCVAPFFFFLSYATYAGLTRKFTGKRRSDGHKVTVYGDKKK
jgi:hypothetical protein